jgi:hypothetical protein
MVMILPTRVFLVAALLCAFYFHLYFYFHLDPALGQAVVDVLPTV